MNRSVVVAGFGVLVLALIGALLIALPGADTELDLVPTRGELEPLSVDDIVMPSSGPSTEDPSSLEVHVSYLPKGEEGDVLVTGPQDFRAQVTETTVLVGLVPGVYKVISESVTVNEVITAPVLPEQVVEVKKDEASFVEVEYANRIAENYVPIPEENLRSATFDEDGLAETVTISDGSLETGDLIGFGVTDETPNGLAGLVTAIRSADGDTQVLELEQATLQDLIPQGKIETPSFTASISDEDVSVFLPSGGGIRSASIGRTRASIPEAIREFLDSCSKTGSALEVDTIGDVAFDITPQLVMSWGWDFDWLDTGVSGTLNARIDIVAKDSFGISSLGKTECYLTDTEIAQKYLPTIAFSIGPVPVVIRPEFLLSLSSNLTLGGETQLAADYQVKAGAWATATGKISVRNPYVRPTDTNSDAYGPDWTWSPPKVSMSGTTEGSIVLTGRVTFQFYGLAGPFGAAGFGPEITGKVEASSESGFAPTTQMVVALKTELSTGVDSSFCRSFGKKVNGMPQALCGQIGQLNKSWTPEPYEIFRHPEEVANVPLDSTSQPPVSGPGESAELAYPRGGQMIIDEALRNDGGFLTWEIAQLSNVEVDADARFPYVQLDETSLVVFGPPPFDGNAGVACTMPYNYQWTIEDPWRIRVSLDVGNGSRSGYLAACSFDYDDPRSLDDRSSDAYEDATAHYMILDPVDENQTGSVDSTVTELQDVPGLPADTPTDITLQELQATMKLLKNQPVAEAGDGNTQITFTSDRCDDCIITPVTFRADTLDDVFNGDLSYEWGDLSDGWRSENGARFENGEATITVPTAATEGMVFFINGTQFDNPMADLAIAMAPPYIEYGEQRPDACWGGTTDSEARIELKIGKSRSGSIAAWDASLPKPPYNPGFQDTPICVVN